MPILILPNKLNHAAGRGGEGEWRGCWDGRVEDTRGRGRGMGGEGRLGGVVNLSRSLSPLIRTS